MPILYTYSQQKSLPNSQDTSFKNFSSNKFRLIAIYTFFFLALCLSYIVPLSNDDLEVSNRDKIIVLICLNAAFFLAFAIVAMKAGSSSKFFPFKDKSFIILTLSTLVLNLELFWIDQQPDISSFFVLIIIGILPSILYISLVDKIVHWALLIGYLCVVYVRTNSDLLGFLVTLNALCTIIIFTLLKREAQNQSMKKLENHELMEKVFSLSTMQAEKAYMVVNKELDLMFANEYFYKFFELEANSASQGRVNEILKEITKVSCIEKMVEIIEDKESDYDKRPTMKSSAKNNNDYERDYFKRSGTTKGQTIKSYLGEGFDDSLKTATTLFFEYSDVLKDVSIGWNNEQKSPMMFPASASFEMQKLFVQFAYITVDSDDMVMIEFGCNEDPRGFSSSPSNLSMTDIASIIHEIRTPLNGTTFLIQQTIENQTVPADVKEDFLVPCLVSTKRLSYVVNDILDFAQILEGKFRLTLETFNLTSTLIQSLQILEALARSKGLETFLHIDPNIPQNITTDQNRLIQIIYNLMGNAIKFTKEGYIKLSVALSVDEPRYIDFLVEDTGYGMKQEDLKKLFKVFEKLDNWHDNKIGSGLGLSIGNALAKALGKTITVESEYKKGSRFKFSIENREKILSASNRNLDININTRRSHMTMENSARLPEFEALERKSRMFSFEEGPAGSTVIPSIFESPKMKPPTFTRKESNEIRTETPNATKIKTIHFDFNYPSTHSVPVSAKQNEIYHIKVDPGIDEALKEEEDTIDFGLINRSNSGVPFLRGKGETSNHSLLSPGVRNLCQCIKVLGVDDEPINTFSLQLTLKEFGLRAKFFSRGDDLIEFMLSNPEQLGCSSCKGPYFILMDCYMPIKDGFETTDELIKAMNRRKVGRIPIIACTADESDLVELKIKQHGMSERVAKPVTRAQFETLIQKYNMKQQFGELEEIKERKILSQETEV